jgi:hypothetical protein
MKVLRKGPSGPPAIELPFYPGGTLVADSSGNIESTPAGTRGRLWYDNGTIWLPTGSAPVNNQVPVYNAATNDYDFKTYINPGNLQYFDNTHSPVACYRFSDTLADFSGNGFDLTASTTFSFSPIYPGKTGVFIPAGGTLVYNVLGSALAILGDVSVQIILQLDGSPGGFQTLIGYTGAGETQATNELYNFGLPATGTPPRRLSWFSEFGAGNNATFSSTGNTGVGFIHNVMYMGARRQNNIITFFLNGLPMGASSAALTPPDGGTSSLFRIGGNASGGAIENVIVFSAKVIAGAISNADFLAEYNRTMGPAFGLL